MVRMLFCMKISEVKKESLVEKSLDCPMDATVWKFITLLSSRLDSDTIPNLFRDNKNSPTVNLLSLMLQNHKMRSTFDFETAINREFGFGTVAGFSVKGINKKECLVWSFKLVDAVGGKGTCANTIFELKEIGSFKGAKRKLKFSNPKPKHYKISEVEECLQKLSVSEVQKSYQL